MVVLLLITWNNCMGKASVHVYMSFWWLIHINGNVQASSDVRTRPTFQKSPIAWTFGAIV